MIKTLIVDDEAPARSRLRRMLVPFTDINIVSEASDGLMALKQIDDLRPDLVFLDIDIPELNGLSVAQAVGTEGPSIIFVTAYNEHALKAFELNAIDYLVKPVSDKRLVSALDRIRRMRESGPRLADVIANLDANLDSRKFAIKCGAKYIACDPTKVSAILARDHYSAIIMEGRELLADDSLDDLAKRLSSRFFRVHRSAIINMDFLCELQREGDRKYIAVLSDHPKTRAPISRDRLDEIKTRLGI